VGAILKPSIAKGVLIMGVLATMLVLPVQVSADSKQRRCPHGGDACLDRLIADMQRNLDRLGCSHDAAFALLYLRTTESIRDAIRAGEFSDRRFWNRVTTAFGRDYLDPLRAWRRGHRRHVPEAWRVAFRAAKRERVLTLGDVMLGINAHVNHDLAFIYYRLRVHNHDDHLHVNDVLARVQQTVLPEIAARLDPTLGSQAPSDPTLSLDIVAWRELAWENAARLAAAPTRAARRRVRARIERHATAMADQIRRAFPVTAAANRERDAFCATHHASSSSWRTGHLRKDVRVRRAQ
jgi:uncharacterized protein DUF5995